MSREDADPSRTGGREETSAPAAPADLDHAGRGETPGPSGPGAKAWGSGDELRSSRHAIARSLELLARTSKSLPRQ